MAVVIIIWLFIIFQQWISYAPVANVAAVYYKVTETKINWFSFVFFICTVVCGLPAFWVIDTLGLRTGVSLVIQTTSFCCLFVYPAMIFFQCICNISDRSFNLNPEISSSDIFI